MTKPKTSSGFSTINLEETINSILNSIDREREKEVVSRKPPREGRFSCIMKRENRCLFLCIFFMESL